MGLIDFLKRERKVVSPIHGMDEEQNNVFNGYNGAPVPGVSADGVDGAVGDVQSVPIAGVSPVQATDGKGGLRTLHSPLSSGTPVSTVFPNSPNAVPPVDSSLQGKPVEPVLAAPTATSPTEVGTSSSAEGNAATGSANASQGNKVNNGVTVTQGESMNNSGSPEKGGQVSVAKKVVSDDLSGMSDADLAKRIEKIEKGRDRLKKKGMTDEQIDAILGDLHGELNGRKVKGLEGNAADGKLSGTPGTVVSSDVEKKGGSGNLSNTDNNSSTTTDHNSTTISTTTGGGANTDLSKNGNNADAKGDKKANNSETKSTEKGANGDANTTTTTTATTTNTTTNTTNTTTDTGDKGKDASGEVNADAVKKALDNPQTAGEKVLGDIIKQSTDDLSKDDNNKRSNLDDYSATELEGLTDEQKEQIKNGGVLTIYADGRKEVMGGLPTLNERQLTAEQNKPDAKPPKTQKQINDEIEALADIKEGDSAELKKLKRERARLSYEIENMPPFVPEETVYPDMPKKVKTDVNYKRVLERIEKERKDRGDDPETKAKREKAHRANLVVASISDLLSGAINLWGAAHGAKSLDLKSGVAKLEKKHKDQIDEGLKIAEQETKELEKVMKEDRDYDKAVNDAALAEYKEVLKQLREAVRARNTAGQKQWDAKRAELQKRLESANRRVEEQTKYEHRWYLNNQTHSQRSSEIAQRGNEQRKTKQTKGAGSTVTHVSNGSGAGAGSGGGAPAQ